MKFRSYIMAATLCLAMHSLAAQINTKVKTTATSKATLSQNNLKGANIPVFQTQASAQALAPDALSQKNINAKSQAVKTFQKVPANATKVNATLSPRRPYHHNVNLVGVNVLLNTDENSINSHRTYSDYSSQITIHLRQVRGKKYLVSLTFESSNKTDMEVSVYNAATRSNNKHQFTLTGGGTQQQDIVIQAGNSGITPISVYCTNYYSRGCEWNFKKAVITEIE